MSANEAAARSFTKMTNEELRRFSSDELDVALEAVCVEFVNVMRRLADQSERTIEQSRQGGVFGYKAERALLDAEVSIRHAHELQVAAGRVNQARLRQLGEERRARNTPEGQVNAILDRLDHEDDDHVRADLLEGLFRLEDHHGEPVSKLLRSAGMPSMSDPGPRPDPHVPIIEPAARQPEGLER